VNAASGRRAARAGGAGAVLLIGCLAAAASCRFQGRQPTAAYQQCRSWSISYPRARARYEFLCGDGDKAEAAPGDAKLVIGYGHRLLEEGRELAPLVERDEWRARVERAVALIAALLPKLDDRTAADAYLVTGSLVSSIDGPADPEVESAFRQAFRRQPTWTTGAAVIDLLTALKRQEVYAIDVCETTYNAAKTEGIPFDKVTALFTACVRVMPNGREPDQNYKAVPATYWQELRSLAARQ
jgi:hypothetical protein